MAHGDIAVGFRRASDQLETRCLAERDEFAHHLEPLSARRAFPSFDQPEFKTPFEVRLRVPEAMQAFANAPQRSRMAWAQRPGFDEVVFEPTAPLPTYLVAFAVGTFDVRSAPERPGKPLLRVITPAGKGGLAAFGLERGERMLAWLSDSRTLVRYDAIREGTSRMNEV